MAFSHASAQIVADFETGTNGFAKAEPGDSLGSALTLATRILDPTLKTTGVLKVKLDFKGSGAVEQGAVLLKQSDGLATLGARMITYWIYVPNSIPSQFTVEVFAVDDLNHSFHGDKFVGSSIPAAKWYPLSLDLARATVLDSSFNLSLGKIARTGILITNKNNTATAWSDSIYVDNVSLVGASPVLIANFESSLNGFANANFGPALTSVSRILDPTATTTGVMSLHWNFPADSATKGAVELAPGGGLPTNGAQFVTYWVYIPGDTMPDTLVVNVFAQSNVSPYTYKDVAFLARDIPKRTWFPLSIDLRQAQINDNTFDVTRLLRTGIQIHSYSYLGSHAAWVDSILVDNAVFLIPPAIPTQPKRVLADFNAPGDIGAFHVLPQWPAAVSVTNGVDTTNADNRVLRAAFSFSDTGSIPADSGGIASDAIGLHSATGDSTVTAITADVYVPVGMPDSANFAAGFQGSATGGKWTSDVYVLGRDIYQGQWNTLVYNVSGHISDSSIINKLGAGTFSIVVSYPAFTPEWTGQIFVDNLTLIGVRGPTTGAGQVVQAPYTYKLYKNYPNPFNPTTAISYELETESDVVLQVFNILGQEVATPVQ